MLQKLNKRDIVVILLLMCLISGFVALGRINMTDDPKKIDFVYKLKDVFDGCISFKYGSSEDGEQYVVGDMIIESNWNNTLGDSTHATTHKYVVISKKETN